MCRVETISSMDEKFTITVLPGLNFKILPGLKFEILPGFKIRNFEWFNLALGGIRYLAYFNVEILPKNAQKRKSLDKFSHLIDTIHVHVHVHVH